MHFVLFRDIYPTQVFEIPLWGRHEFNISYMPGKIGHPVVDDIYKYVFWYENGHFLKFESHRNVFSRGPIDN